MKIAIGSDHAGFVLKNEISGYLRAKRHKVIDLGAFSEDRVDYPDYAKKVAKTVASKKADMGILVCGSGIGMSMSANKVKGIRAAVCESIYTAKMSRMHNDANILCLGARILPKKKAFAIIDLWLKTSFEGGRHIKRVRKIEAK